MKDLEYFKKELIKILDKKEREEKTEIKKSLAFTMDMLIEKSSSGYPIGTIREWKGNKYQKIAPGKWRRKYSSEEKGIRMSIAALKKAIDKCSKVMGLGYPGGPIIDKLARQGNPNAYEFSKPNIAGYDYSFSGLKTSFLYKLREWVAEDPDFIEHHKEDLAASLEKTIVDILMKKLRQAVKDTGIKQVAVAGGVSANNGLRDAYRDHAKRYGWKIFIPKFSYTTDNAAMIGITGYFKYLDGDFATIDLPAYARMEK